MLSPDEIANRQFLVGLRGFDRDEVSAFLSRVAETVDALEQRVEELEAELSEATAAPVPPPAPPVPAPVAPASPTDFAAIGRETQRILEAANEAAQHIRGEANTEAETRLASARETAERTIADGKARRASIEDTVAQLDALRGRLAGELEEVAERVRSNVGGLRTPLPPVDGSVDDDSDTDPLERAAVLASARGAEAADTETGAGSDAGVGTGAGPDTGDVAVDGPLQGPLEGGPLPGDDDAATEAFSTLEETGPLQAAVSDDERRQPVTDAASADPVGAGHPGGEESHDGEPAAHAGDQGFHEQVPDAAPGPVPAPPRPTGPTRRSSVFDVSLDPEPAGLPADLADVSALQEDDVDETARRRAAALAPLYPQFARRLKRGFQELQARTFDEIDAREGSVGLWDLLPDDDDRRALGDIGHEYLSRAYAAAAEVAAELTGEPLSEPDGGRTLARAFSREAIERAEDAVRTALEGRASDRLTQEDRDRLVSSFEGLRGSGTEELAGRHLVGAFEQGLDDALAVVGLDRSALGNRSGTAAG